MSDDILFKSLLTASVPPACARSRGTLFAAEFQNLYGLNLATALIRLFSVRFLLEIVSRSVKDISGDKALYTRSYLDEKYRPYLSYVQGNGCNIYQPIDCSERSSVEAGLVLSCKLLRALFCGGSEARSGIELQECSSVEAGTYHFVKYLIKIHDYARDISF
ncbi:hypothetical protein F4604DRAFT_1686129 [Suillus subluteus]|nr:hypothetical protein F4604DRAFT_1686129 [Suillus subluteus]